jgi:hypothetical protein
VGLRSKKFLQSVGYLETAPGVYAHQQKVTPAFSGFAFSRDIERAICQVGANDRDTGKWMKESASAA